MLRIEAAMLKPHLGWSGFKDQLKSSLLQARISLNTWETEAANHPSWGKVIHFGYSTLEGRRKPKEEAKRRQCKTWQFQPRPSPTLPCDQCLRLFHSHLAF
uniref:Uncharacterized protein n=1 Tax=Octopus bimaculoides TaxID=37653 RepID=A0A0L8G8T3_OCTBM